MPSRVGAGLRTGAKSFWRGFARFPEKGAANAALERLMADHFGIAKSAVAVASGATSRIKQVRLSGDPQRLADAIDRLPELKG
jgi:uncharacterized protein YggU (UPF0235/DUF167 family)